MKKDRRQKKMGSFSAKPGMRKNPVWFSLMDPSIKIHLGLSVSLNFLSILPVTKKKEREKLGKKEI